MVILSMEFEIIDAVESYYKDDLDSQIDIFTWLNDRCKNTHRFADWLEEHGCCPICGEKMIYKKIQEYHSEVDYNNIEVIYVKTCPICGD